METILSNKLQEIKEQEQAVKEQKDFIRASFIAAIKETTHPSVKKIGSVLHTISYKDMYNWDVRGEILENFLCRYIEQNPLCVALKVIEKLNEKGICLYIKNYNLETIVDGKINPFKLGICENAPIEILVKSDGPVVVSIDIVSKYSLL